MTGHRIAKALTAALLAAAAGACSTPAEVRSLADKTAANVGTIGAHLRQLDQNGRDMAELRAASISRLHAANADLRARYEYDVELIKKSGEGGNLRLIDDIEAWTAKVDEIFSKAKTAEAERKAKVLASQTKLDTKQKALSEVAQALATLAREEKARDRVRFLKGFAKDLKAELDKKLAEDNEGAKAAKALLAKAKDRVAAGTGEATSRLNETQ